jgi:hypothetical protein
MSGDSRERPPAHNIESMARGRRTPKGIPVAKLCGDWDFSQAARP